MYCSMVKPCCCIRQFICCIISSSFSSTMGAGTSISALETAFSTMALLAASSA